MNRVGTIFHISFKYSQWQVFAKGYGVDEEGPTKVVLTVKNGLVDRPDQKTLGLMHQEAWMQLLEKYTEKKDDLLNVRDEMYEV